MPTFSNPTMITNPLFPTSNLPQVVQLDEEAGEKLRFETTQLPATRVVDWQGQQVETRVTHFVAHTEGRLVEVATIRVAVDRMDLTAAATAAGSLREAAAA